VRDGRIVGVVLGAGALAVGTAAVMLYRRPKLMEVPGSPRERLPVAPPLPSPSLAPVSAPGGSIYGRGGSFDPDYPPEVWFPIVSSLILKDYRRIDPRIAMKWLVMESDGAPCAFGIPSDKGPDGEPSEIGLGQIVNPDDFKLLGLAARGISPSMFRAYCAPNSQRRTRRLTSKEMEDQVRDTLLAKIDQSMGVADGVVLKYGLKWQSADYWKLVKSSHAWPPILNTGLPAVVKKLGRAPRSWSEFRQVLGMDSMIKDDAVRSKTYGQVIPKHSRWHNGLNNAEELASAVVDVRNV
jgi:hypothetical protein